jgi:hypothetical protein
LIEEACGIAFPAGKSRRFPGAVGSVTVVLITTEVALEGIPQRPTRTKVRSWFARRAGPP